MLIYKIFRADEWRAFEAAGETQGAPIDLADGFVHFSTADQVQQTAALHFAGAEELRLLALDCAALGPQLRWNPSRGGALFPHLYRVLRIEDVLWQMPLPVFENAHLFGEPVTGFIDPTRDSFDAFKTLDRDTPIEMLNMVRLRAHAAYPEGHALADAGLSGGEAYARYGAESGPVFTGLGGEIIWRGGFETTLIGPESEHWDRLFIARYPNAHAFFAMVTDPAYGAAVIHRQAAVRTSRLIRCAPRDAGAGFA